MKTYICQYCHRNFTKPRERDFLNHENRCPQNKNRKYRNGMSGKTPWNKGLKAEDFPQLARPSLYNDLTKSELNDDGKLSDKYFNKEVNAAREGIPFELSQLEFIQLLSEAGIKSSDLGIDKHHLARYGDNGPYKIGNCRFIHYLENAAEKKISQKMRDSGSRNIRTWNNRKR